MYQQQIWFSNATDIQHMPIISYAHETAMSVYIPHLNSIQSAISQQALVYTHFTLLAYTPCRYACHIAYICPTALVL